MTQHSEYQEVTFKSKDFEERHREQYKRDMMLQLVTNNALVEIIQSAYKSDTTGEFHNVIGTMAEKLTEEAFK